MIITKVSTHINNQITASKVRLIDSQGKMIGIVDLKQAKDAALQQDLDLVEISPNASPPVCKVMDYGKYRYEQQKKNHEARKKQKVVDVKEVKIRPNIEDGDYDVKLRNIKRFITSGDKVKVSLMFRGREIAHNDVGFAVMERLKKDSEEFTKVEFGPKMEGRNISMVLISK